MVELWLKTVREGHFQCTDSPDSHFHPHQFLGSKSLFHLYRNTQQKNIALRKVSLLKTCLPLRAVISLDEDVPCMHEAESYGDGEKTKQTSRGHRDDLRSAFS